MKLINLLNDKKMFKNNDIFINDKNLNMFLTYEELLTKWNKIHNLISKNAISNLLTHHFLDSLSILPFLPNSKILDVGSGAGFPGCPIAIASPGLSVFLIEKNKKKLSFLYELKNKLNLENLSIIDSDVKNFSPEKKFKVIVSRAFACLEEFYSSTKHICSKNGSLYAMKGKINNNEIKEVSVNIKEIIKLKVPYLKESRHLIVIKNRT